MQTVFLETNAINACYYKEIPGERLAEILRIRHLTPIVSHHTGYELARTFKNEKNKSIGIAFFSI